MVKVIEKDFWEKESVRLIEELVPPWEERQLPGEFEILYKFFRSKSFPKQFTPEEREQLESKAKDLGYSSTQGISVW